MPRWMSNHPRPPLAELWSIPSDQAGAQVVQRQIDQIRSELQGYALVFAGGPQLAKDESRLVVGERDPRPFAQPLHDGVEVALAERNLLAFADEAEDLAVFR